MSIAHQKLGVVERLLGAALDKDVEMGLRQAALREALRLTQEVRHPPMLAQCDRRAELQTGDAVRQLIEIECDCSCATKCPQGRAGSSTKCRIVKEEPLDLGQFQRVT